MSTNDLADTSYLAGIGESFQTTASTGPLVLAIGVCVLAGLVSFASPCVVPLVPGYLSSLAGVVGADEAVAADFSEVVVPSLGGEVRVLTLPYVTPKPDPKTTHCSCN